MGAEGRSWNEGFEAEDPAGYVSSVSIGADGTLFVGNQRALLTYAPDGTEKARTARAGFREPGDICYVNELFVSAAGLDAVDPAIRRFNPDATFKEEWSLSELLPPDVDTSKRKPLALAASGSSPRYLLVEAGNDLEMWRLNAF